MIEYRPFLNTDPPLLADVWRSQAPLRGLAQAISNSILEKHVFSKPYFDRNGLCVAIDDGRVIGFSHSGFGPNEDGSSLDTKVGVISRIMVINHEHRQEVADKLLEQAEAYLKAHHVDQVIAGGHQLACPFYLGLYGGSRLPGILDEDEFLANLFRSHAYKDDGKQLIYQARMSAFRPVVNRQQMKVRRQYQIMAVIDPIPENWWDACTLGMTDRTKFLLIDRKSGLPHGYVTFWDIEPLSSAWGVHAMGLFDLYIEEPYRRGGLATFLVGEALRQLHSQGITVAEVQMQEDDEPVKGLFSRLGFELIDQGQRLVKFVSNEPLNRTTVVIDGDA